MAYTLNYFWRLATEKYGCFTAWLQKIRLGGLQRRLGGSTLGAIAVSCVRHALAAVVFSRHLRLMCCVAVAFHFRDLRVRRSTLVRGEW